MCLVACMPLIRNICMFLAARTSSFHEVQLQLPLQPCSKSVGRDERDTEAAYHKLETLGCRQKQEDAYSTIYMQKKNHTVGVQRHPLCGSQSACNLCCVHLLVFGRHCRIHAETDAGDAHGPGLSTMPVQ